MCPANLREGKAGQDPTEGKGPLPYIPLKGLKRLCFRIDYYIMFYFVLKWCFFAFALKGSMGKILRFFF